MKELMLAMWIAHGADIGTTIVGLNRGCQELNPIYRSASTGQMVGIKAMSAVTITAFAWGAKKQGRPKLAKTILISSLIVGAGAAGWNLTQIGKC